MRFRPAKHLTGVFVTCADVPPASVLDIELVLTRAGRRQINGLNKHVASLLEEAEDRERQRVSEEAEFQGRLHSLGGDLACMCKERQRWIVARCVHYCPTRTLALSGFLNLVVLVTSLKLALANSDAAFRHIRKLGSSEHNATRS
jgi:hypothetical protein